MLGGLLTVVILGRPQELRQLLVCPVPATLLLLCNLRRFARPSGPWATGSRVALYMDEAFGHMAPPLAPEQSTKCDHQRAANIQRRTAPPHFLFRYEVAPRYEYY